MAYVRPKDLDGFMELLQKSDTKFRQQLGTDLLSFLAEPSNPIVCQDIGMFIDGFITWMHSSNYKVASNGIEILTYLIDRLGHDFRPYLQTVLPTVIDRLGDAKDTVREKAQLLILKLLERNVLTPQTLLEKLQPGFSHKNSKIREEVLRCLVNTVNEHGAHSLSLSKFIPDIVNLLSDPTATVRDTAFNTLVELYKHVGDKLRLDLQRRNIVPQSKWPTLAARFDEAKARGELLPSAQKSIDLSTDEPDRTVMAKPQVPVKKPTLGSAYKQKIVSTVTSASGAGGLDEDTFCKSFEDCPVVQIFSAREVTDHMKNIQDIISDSNKDWNKRVDALKKLRSLIIAGATQYEEFYVGLKNLEIPLQGSIKDLRSQVVREACITITYLSQNLGNKFDKAAEFLLQPLINLIQNSAKVMATSGHIAVKFIIQHTHSPRLIPIITYNAQKSKSKDIRRACCEFLELMLTHWPKHPLERHIGLLQETVKVGIADADPDARVSARRAFKGLQMHFPEQAEVLLQSLDPSYRRALQGEGMSASSSTNNIASTIKSTRSYGRTPSSASASASGPRSNSAIDLQAAQRAKARAQYSAMARSKIQSGTASLPRPKKISDTPVMSSPERGSRTRSRNSQSQPTSRSASPSSRLAYLYQRSTDHDSPRPRKLSSGIPRSTQGSRDTSRETSPTRGSNITRFRRGSDRPPLNPSSRPVLAQKILQQSREAENALADVLGSADPFRSPRRNMRSLENHSDDSETSSVCSERSERSFDSFKRTCDSYSWSGSQHRLSSRDLWEPARDINQIIALCASTVWQERKDGLRSLQYYLTNEIRLTSGELKHLTEIFTKMFMDSHTKGLSFFLDTLHEVIALYKDELHSWVYVLLQRVFMKIGTETLNSVQGKLITTLEIVKSNFPHPLLVSNVFRFLVDATQTPNTKVKVTVMNFLTSLCQNAEVLQDATVQPLMKQALQKIIIYAQDPKSPETRNAAKLCLVAMWNCNTPQVTMILTELPKEQQDLASSIVHNHMRGSGRSEPSSPMATGSPKILSPGISPSRDGLDQEEFYKSLRKTTAEIQNYGFEGLGSKLDRDRDTTSQDSGISQMSDTIKDMALMEDRIDDTPKPNFNVSSGSRSLPYANDVTITDTNGFRSLGDANDPAQIILNIIEKCSVSAPTPVRDKRVLLNQLLDMVKLKRVEHVQKNFKLILRLLLDNLKIDDSVIKTTVLKIFREVFENPDMTDYWSNFVQLLTLRVLEAHTDLKKREVIKEAEETAAAMKMFPLDTLINTLAPLIRTNPYPFLLGAIKMLTKLVEVRASEITDEHLKAIMPGLIHGTDHNESPVRKSSIFCLVALHKAVGEERLAPYMKMMSGSKMKLLMLYIDKAEHNIQNTSVPTSPKNGSSNTS